MQRDETLLSAKQTKALEALLSEASQEEAARKAGISRTTLFRWLQEEHFKRAYEDALQLSFASALKSLQVVATEAMTTLREVLRDPLTPPAARVSAVRCALEFALKAREQNELEARLTQLEQAYGQQSGNLLPFPKAS